MSTDRQICARDGFRAARNSDRPSPISAADLSTSMTDVWAENVE